MPGLPIFIVGDYLVRPDVPETWSFTALIGFEECPRRWALARAEIPCFGGIVPQKPSRSGIEGTLLHGLIERFARHATGTEVFRPRRALLELVAEWAKTNASNLRIDSKALAGQVRIEEILRAFAEACNHVKQRDKQPVNGPSYTHTTKAVEGPEVWLRDPKSKLCGRADFISTSEIVDFKSGDQQDHHAEQLAFYGALHLVLTGRSPAGLRLVYTSTNEVREIPVPAMKELEFLLEELRRKAATADQQVANGDFPAKPDSTKCMYCHVRGLCDAYWKNIETQEPNATADQAPVVDYSPTAAARVETAALGIYVRDSWAGFQSVLHVPHEVAGKVGTAVRRLRALALRANKNAEGVRFAFTQSSEIYII